MKTRQLSLLLMAAAVLMFLGLLPGCSDSNPSVHIPDIPTVSPTVAPSSSPSASSLSPSYRPSSPSTLPPKVSKKSSEKGVLSRSLSQDYSINSGWTLVSFPFSAVTSIEGLEYQLAYFNGYDYSYLDPYTNLSLVDTGKAYWIYSDRAGTVSVTGTVNDGELNSISLKSGWNLVGCPANKALPFSNMSVTRQGGSTKTIAAAVTESLDPSAAWLYRMMLTPTGNALATQDISSEGSGCKVLAGQWLFAWADVTINLNVNVPANVPKISLSSNSLNAGDTLRITGSALGDSTTGLVSINGLTVPAANINSWNATAISLTVPSGVTSGDCAVFVNHFPSNSVPVTVGSSGTFKSISGRVVENSTSERALAGAQICIDTGHNAVSDSQGNFSIYDVPAGQHAVYVVRIGYKTAFGLITLEENKTRTVNVALSPATGTSTGGDVAEETGSLNVTAHRKRTSNDEHTYWVSKITVSEQGNYSNRWSNSWDSDDTSRTLVVSDAIIGRNYNISVEWKADDGWEKSCTKSIKMTDKSQSENIYNW